MRLDVFVQLTASRTRKGSERQIIRNFTAGKRSSVIESVNDPRLTDPYTGPNRDHPENRGLSHGHLPQRRHFQQSKTTD